MDITEVIGKRKSIRAFKSDPVSLDLIKKIMEPALRAPSWANTQPWEFAVVTGKPLKQIQDGFVAKGDTKPYPDIDRPYEFPEPYITRINALRPGGRDLTKEEEAVRRINNFSHYGAPAVIYLLIGRNFYYETKGINVWSLYDCGSAILNIMLLATNYGLGTIAQAQAVVFPDIIRRFTDIPDSKLIAIGIAIGYPDWGDPKNEPWRTREPLDRIATFHGFDMI